MSVPTCGLCPAFLFDPESVALRRCFGCRSAPAAFRVGPPANDFRPTAASPAFVLALADRILAAHEVIGRRAEKREWSGTEEYSCPLG